MLEIMTLGFVIMLSVVFDQYLSFKALDYAFFNLWVLWLKYEILMWQLQHGIVTGFGAQNEGIKFYQFWI